jgi:hypothetical protein
MNLNALSNTSKSLSGSIIVIAGSIRDDIESVQSCWLWLLLACTLVVAVGVVIEEAVEHLSDEHKQWIVKPGWHHSLARIGWILVIVGVLGEGMFEAAIFFADRTLQEFNNTLLAITTEQAGNAAKSAKIAHDEADSAKQSAALAQDKVREVNKRADELSTGLDKSLLKQGALEKELQTDEKNLSETAAFAETLKAATGRLAYRIGQRTFNRETTVSFLKDRSKGNVDIWYKKADNREPFLFAQELKSALDEGGWHTSELHELTTEVLSGPPWSSINKSRQIGAVLIMRRPPGFPTFRDPTPIGVIATVLIGGPDFGFAFNGEFDPSLTEDHVILGIFEAAKP